MDYVLTGLYIALGFCLGAMFQSVRIRKMIIDIQKHGGKMD